MSRRLIALLLGGFVLATLVTSSGVTAAGDDVGAFSATKTVARETVDAFGNATTVDSKDVTLKVDHTKNLQGRERVQVSWSGARVSAGRATNPYGENGLAQEYPMVILQCRGRDDSSLPASKRISPETCWTSTRQQRSQMTDTSAAVWRLDPKADAADRGQVSGVSSIPKGCTAPGAGSSVHLTPFKAANGKVYSACSADTMPPEAAVDGSFPAAEQSAFTGTNGKGETSFEVRSKIENESLGCDESTPCSIVAIPIMGMSCERGTGELADTNAACRAKGQFEPGSSNFAGLGVDDAVSPLYWWADSNWDNRISVPITFGASPNVCTVLDTREPVGFYGSELMSQATLQWAPAYCLRKDRFKFQHNVQPDQASFTLMEQKEVPGAFVSSAQEDTGDDTGSPEYAPTAVTGFAVSYVVDKPDNAGEKTDVKLNARLLAKLLTQSYPASSLGKGHPGLGDNPLSINLDPEFKALNPGLDTTSREAAAVIMSLSESSDVIKALTQYFTTDPEASAFIAGQPDPWGMTVNPSYKDISLPVSEWPLLDEFIPSVNDPCLQANNTTPYLPRLAAPVTSFRKIAEAVLDAWPLAQIKCSGDGNQIPFVLGRSDRQGVGTRMIFGITTIGDAERFGLRTAALQSTQVKATTKKFTGATGRTFVGPTRDGMAKAITTAKQAKRGAPFTLDMEKVRQTKGAYPGTLIVYTAARTAGLEKPTAKTVASFIRTATTEGQRPGSGNGYLPDGYLPITKAGTTAALFSSAQQVAADIEGQVGESATQPPSGPPSSGTTGDAGLTDAVPDAADDAAADDAPKQATSDQLESLGSTESLTSALAAWALPALVLLGLLAGLAGPSMRVLAARRRLK